MFLKRIEAQGFKSFADKTVLEFGQGATAIVGPNGSGKSNISDAIRWVMGEMSAKTLRGSSMQDVIFAGTQTRKAVNFAEVSLVLDNSAKVFSLEFEEITVTRRVFRSGESAYYINKAACRLKDIHELFMDTGLGRDGYSIIGQGSVAQILSTKAEDRRSIFEEAAGISKYKHRKEESQRKLATVNDNLLRINDIINELETQLKPLSDQSEKARKYLTLYEEFKALDISMCLSSLNKNDKQKKQTDSQYRNVCCELDDLLAKEGEFEKKLSALYDENKQNDLISEQTHDELRKANAEYMSGENDIAIAQNNIDNDKTMLERIDKEIVDLQDKNIQAKKSIEEFEIRRKEYETEISDISEEFANMKNANSDMESEIEGYKNHIEDMKSDTIQLMNEISSAKASISGLDNLRNSFIERRQAVENELKMHDDGLSDTQSNIDATMAEINEKKAKLDEMKERMKRFEARLEKVKNESGECVGRLNELRVEYNSKSSKKKMLADMENSLDGYARSVKMVLKAQELKNISMYGTVSSVIDVEKRYITAIEIALGGAMQNIVVETENDAKTAIEYLKRTRGGRATFLPISSVNGKVSVPDLSACRGYIGVASELVSCNSRYRGIITNLLGRVAVVDNIDNAIAISRQYGYKFRIVTLEGDVLNSGGSMSGGSTTQNSGFLSRSNEIKTLTAEIEVISETIKKLAERQQELQSDYNNNQNQLTEYTALVRVYEDELLKLENTSLHLTHEIESSSKHSQALKNELEQIEKQLEISNEEFGKYISDISLKENKLASVNAEIEKAEEKYNQALEVQNDRAKLVMDKTLKLNELKKDTEVVSDKILGIKNDIRVNEGLIAEKYTDKENISSHIKALTEEIEKNKNGNGEIRKLCDSLQKKIEEIAVKKGNVVKDMQKIQSSNKELTDKLLVLQEEKSRIENKLEKLTSEYDGIVNRLWDDYELTYSDAEKTAKESNIFVEDIGEISKRVGELKAQMKSLGSINLESIEEYKNVKTRFEFLSEQKKDLDNSKDNLNKIIASMQELMEEHFTKQFKAINDSFQNVFNELFGGGRGGLYLSEPNNVLESGIEIEAQLPGKGLQNINLYSGGERSFIAIALLFAILNVKPTPFCILDEIDAALDDVNVSRFATYLKNYISTTQFIIITHRRGTMEAANVLYGVTMQEKGVSKLLSLHIDDVAEDMAK